jgi:hypothetical protein
MSKRNDQGQFAKAPSKKSLVGSWLLSLLSLSLLWLTATMVKSNFASFRSCSANNNGLYLTNCGKQSLNGGDLVLIGLFLLATFLAFSLFTHAWRLTRRTI